MTTKFCGGCGTQLALDEMFCTSCGRKAPKDSLTVDARSTSEVLLAPLGKVPLVEDVSAEPEITPHPPWIRVFEEEWGKIVGEWYPFGFLKWKLVLLFFVLLGAFGTTHLFLNIIILITLYVCCGILYIIQQILIYIGGHINKLKNNSIYVKLCNYRFRPFLRRYLVRTLIFNGIPLIIIILTWLTQIAIISGFIKLWWWDASIPQGDIIKLGNRYYRFLRFAPTLYGYKTVNHHMP